VDYTVTPCTYSKSVLLPQATEIRISASSVLCSGIRLTTQKHHIMKEDKIFLLSEFESLLSPDLSLPPPVPPTPPLSLPSPPPSPLPSPPPSPPSTPSPPSQPPTEKPKRKKRKKQTVTTFNPIY